METQSQPRRSVVATVGRWLFHLLDFTFLAVGLVGSATGFVLVARGVQDRYAPEFLLVGSLFLIVFLALIFAWSVSHRLTLLTERQKQLQGILEEVLRRTEK